MLEERQLVQLITSEILKVIGKQSDVPSARISAKRKALVFGDISRIDKSLRQKFDLEIAPEGKHIDEISEYECIIILSISTADLVDISIVRDETPLAHAVIHALLEGKKVYLADSALDKVEQAKKHNPQIYARLKKCLDSILGFGIELWHNKEQMELASFTEPAKQKCCKNFSSNVVTEAIARELVSQNKGKEIVLPKSIIITPSAKDIFLHSGKYVGWEK